MSDLNKQYASKNDLKQLWEFVKDRFALNTNAIGSASLEKTNIDNIIYFTAVDDETARGSIALNPATNTTAGLMSADDKLKLNNLNDIKSEVINNITIERIDNNPANGFNINIYKGFGSYNTRYNIPLANFNVAGLMSPTDKDRLYNKTGVLDGLFLGNDIYDKKAVAINTKNKSVAIGLKYLKRNYNNPPQIILEDLYGMARSVIDASDFLVDYYIEHNLKNIELDSNSKELIFRWNILGGGTKIVKIPFIGEISGGGSSVSAMNENDIQQIFDEYQTQIPINIKFNTNTYGDPILVDNTFIGLTSESTCNISCEVDESNPIVKEMLKNTKRLNLKCYCSLKFIFSNNENVKYCTEFPNDPNCDNTLPNENIYDLILIKYNANDEGYSENIKDKFVISQWDSNKEIFIPVPDNTITLSCPHKLININNENKDGAIIIKGQKSNSAGIHKFSEKIKDCNKVFVYLYFCVHNQEPIYKINIINQQKQEFPINNI